MSEHRGAREKADIIVCGGGPAGMAAALAAAKLGAEVILVERYGSLGGLASMGYVSTVPLPPNHRPKTLTAILRELSNLKQLHTRKPGGIEIAVFNPEALKLVADAMLARAGVGVLFETLVVGCISRRERQHGIVVESKSGRQELLARVIIDATGDGDVAIAAGAPFRVEKRRLLPLTLMYVIAGVESERFQRYSSKDPELRRAARKAGFRYQSLGAKPELRGPAMISLEPFQKGAFLVWSNPYTTNPLDPRGVSQAQVRLRKRVWAELDFLRGHVPGFENAYLVATAPYLGVRESRRVVGEYVLREGDAGRPFPDTIGYLWYSGMRAKVYPLPYRCLLPRRTENLLVAGRCFSATHSVQNKLREIPACMMMGEAAGVAGALSVRSNMELRELKPEDIRFELARLKA
jgi:hypothetical protein